MPEPQRIKHNTTRRMRLDGYNYSTPGYYFMTVCQHNRQHLFCRIDAEGHRLTPAGTMVLGVTAEIQSHFAHTLVDSVVVMPNHVHMLLGINLDEGDYAPVSAIAVMHWWKTQTTNRYGYGVKLQGWPRYNRALWQEGYHDRVVRDQRELEYIRYYIEQNPKRWHEDTFFDES